MKKSRLLSLALLFVGLMTVGAACNQPTPSQGSQSVSGVEIELSLSKDTIELDTYQTLWLFADYNGEDTVVWTTSNPTVVSVEDGKLVGLKAGTATVTATAGTLSKSCEVVVGGYTAELLSLDIGETNLTLYRNEETTVHPTRALKRLLIFPRANTKCFLQAHFPISRQLRAVCF